MSQAYYPITSLSMLPKHHPIQRLIDKLYKQLIEGNLPKAEYKSLLNLVTDLEHQLPFYVKKGERNVI